MTIAELHGKLNPERTGGAHERMEDLLTSDVFGTMKYVGWRNGFMDWLRSSRSPNGKCCADTILPTDNLIRNVNFAFWPLLKNNREPDLLIGIITIEEEMILLMIEAKYFSGASDTNINIEDITPERSGNQIADQVNCFPDFFPSINIRAIHRVHIYVTAQDLCPVNIYERAAEHIMKADISLFWLNWQTLPYFLERVQEDDMGRQAMINDLIKLLERKDLIPFNGFKTIKAGAWKSLVGKSFFQGQPLWSASLPNLLSPTRFFVEEL